MVICYVIVFVKYESMVGLSNPFWFICLIESYLKSKYNIYFASNIVDCRHNLKWFRAWFNGWFAPCSHTLSGYEAWFEGWFALV